MSTKDQVFSCELCEEPYSLADIKELRFFPSTGICYACYRKGASAPPEVWCFGKKEKYKPELRECSELCPDRVLCPLFVSGAIVKMKKEGKREQEEETGST